MRLFSCLLVLLCFALAACPSTEPVDPPAEPVDHPPVRFIAMGDTGEGNQNQYDVAAVVESVCADQGCDFVLLLGDNIYDTGVTALDDVQWQEKFELPYANLDMPFYAVLGNHDYGNLSPDGERADFQVAYTDVSEKWRMPARHYSHSMHNVDFFALDTQSMMFPEALADEFDAQETWLEEQLAGESEGWRIVYGHHPYISNGRHGNAGNYDGFPPKFDISGIRLKDRFESTVCGAADLYLCGHDHDREWLEQTCDGTQFIVTGAGAKLRDFDDAQPTHWADDQTEGFTWFEIDDDRLTLQFWDRTGVMNYEGGWDR
jgi:tartrate-resistant acid phosphatase type 5